MANLNKALLIGNVGKDAELKYLASGTPTCQFSLAVNHSFKKGDEWEQETEWFNVTMFGDHAERVSQYITKGKQAYVEGRFKTRSWDDDKGVKHYRTEIIANTVQLLDKREGDSGRGGQQERPQAQSQRPAKRTQPEELPWE